MTSAPRQLEQSVANPLDPSEGEGTGGQCCKYRATSDRMLVNIIFLGTFTSNSESRQPRQRETSVLFSPSTSDLKHH